MKRIARLFALLLCLLLALGALASCGKGDDGIYTVTFSINGKKTKVEVPKGEIPVCPEELLSWETSEHYYKVTGWDKEIVPACNYCQMIMQISDPLPSLTIRVRDC